MSLTKKVLEALPNNVKEVSFCVCAVPIEDLPDIKAVGVKFAGKTSNDEDFEGFIYTQSLFEYVTGLQRFGLRRAKKIVERVDRFYKNKGVSVYLSSDCKEL